jgi:hypothetical protein
MNRPPPTLARGVAKPCPDSGRIAASLVGGRLVGILTPTFATTS